MQAIIIFKRTGENADGGIYNNISYKAAVAGVGENNIISYIPLKVSGRTYTERKNDIETKAIEWSNTCGEYPRWSYGELAIINDFFEINGRRYGLIKEFRENGII